MWLWLPTTATATSQALPLASTPILIPQVSDDKIAFADNQDGNSEIHLIV